MLCIASRSGLGIDYEFLQRFCSDVLSTDKSVRWAGVVNKNGVIISQQTRHGLRLLLTEEENEQYAGSAIARQRTRGKYESKIGRMFYAFGRYEKLHRATIPINENYYLLVTIDIEQKNFDAIIMDKILPVITGKKDQFVKMDDSI